MYDRDKWSICHDEIRDGLKLTDIKVSQAKRLTPKGKNKTGLIIATVDTFEQKQKLMKSKTSLKKSKNFANVYVENGLTPEMRNNDNNLRQILKMVGKERNFKVFGGRILPNKTS